MTWNKHAISRPTRPNKSKRMLLKVLLPYLAFVASVFASNASDDKGRCPRRCSSSSSSSSSSCCRMDNPGAPCTNCGCAQDERQSCPFLQLPLRLLPTGCPIPQNYFAGKRVLVIGATSGFGRQTAQLFLEHGAKVVGTSRNPKKAPKVPYPLMKVNIGHPEEVDKLVHDYVKEHGCPPDILIDNGANAALGTSMDIGTELRDYTLRAVGSGHIRLIEGFIHKLPSKKSRFISLTTISALAFSSIPMMTYYDSAKYLLRQYIENWGMENSPIYPNVFLGYVAPSIGNTNFPTNAIWPGVETNPLAAQFKQAIINLLAAGMDPIWVGRAFLEFAYTQYQGQTCDVGYYVGNQATPETLAADYGFLSYLTNVWNNKYPLDYINEIKNLWAPFGGPIYVYNTTYTQCA